MLLLVLPKIIQVHKQRFPGLRMSPSKLAPAVAAVLVVGLQASGWAAAATAEKKKPSAKSERIAELREQIGEVSEQEGSLLEEIAGIRERLEELNAAVRRYGREVAAAQRLFSKAERALAKAEAERAAVAARLVDAKAAVEAARQAMNLTVTNLYQRGASEEQAVYAAIVETSRSPNEVLAATHYMKGALLEDRANFEHFLALQREVERLDREAEARRTEAQAARDQLAAERQRVEGLRAEAVAARAAARAEEDREQELLAEVQSKKADFERELGLLQIESSAIGEWLRSIQAGQKLAPRQKRTFKPPVAAPMSSRFGPRVHPIYGDTRVHTGVDFAVGSGVPIRASGPGLVVWAAPRGGYGNLVIVEHGNGLATLYAHQSRLDVTVGQRVTAGQVVGAVGSTGMSTGPHLHFETRELGTPVDPLHYL